MSSLLSVAPKVAGAVSIMEGVIDVPDHVAGGLPFDEFSRLAVEVDGVVDHYHQGLAFSAVGRLAITYTGPPTRVGTGGAPLDDEGRLVMEISVEYGWAVYVLA